MSPGHAIRRTPRIAAEASAARMSPTTMTATSVRSYSPFAWSPSVSRNSIGIGKTIVELFVAPISSSVCR